MCKISLLNTGHFDSWCTLLHLPIYHMMRFFPLATQASHPAASPRSAEWNDTATPQDLWEIHSRLPSCSQNTLSPTKELHPSLVVYKERAHLLGVTKSMSPAACLLWQVLIENQAQSFLCPSFTTLPWITLNANTKTQFMSWSFTIQKMWKN